jgi:ABC-2 type transport system permease protein
LGTGVLFTAVLSLGRSLVPAHLLTFLLMLGTGMVVLYAILLLFAALVFWSPGFLFTWIFDGIFQMARYPMDLYPGWVRTLLTWVVPVGIITTVPIQALSGTLGWEVLVASLVLASGLLLVASRLFRTGLKRYASASS